MAVAVGIVIIVAVAVTVACDDDTGARVCVGRLHWLTVVIAGHVDCVECGMKELQLQR